VDRFRACVRRELVFLALGAMDVCVITPLVAALLSLIVPVRPLPITAVFLGAVLVVHYLARAGLRLPLHPLFRSGLLGAGMLVSGLLVVHQLLHAQTYLWNPAWLVGVFRGLQQESLSQDVLIFLLVVFWWWRGLVLAQRRLDSGSVAFRFRLGLVMLAVTTAVGGLIIPWPLYQVVFAFFFISLLGIALARAEEVGQQYGGRQSPFGLGWLAMLVTTILIVLLLAAGVTTLLAGGGIGRFVGPALEVLSVVVTALVYVLAWIVYVVTAFLSAVFGEIEWEGFEGLPALPQPGAPVQPRQPFFTPEQLALAKAAGIIGGVLLLLLVIALSLRRLRARGGRHRGDERESVWEGVHLRRSLRDLLRGGRRRLDGAAAVLGKFFAALTIRRIYAHLSALAAERGYPRALHETPYEYLPVLEQSFPDSREEVARITEAYVAVHYGEAPERPEHLKAIQAAWERIRETAATRPR
jgi:hypothetical protein